MLIEQLVLALLVYCRLANQNGLKLSDESLYGDSSTKMYIAVALVGLTAMLQIRLIMCYKEVQGSKADEIIQSGSRLFLGIVAAISAAYHQIFAIFLQILIALAYFQSIHSNQESNGGAILLTICATILQLQLFVLAYIDKTFINLQFPSRHFTTASAQNQPFILNYMPTL
ncbi:hypothetical protein FGO68_gene3996 [Halteria grandinella]|uniref:Uncharacterized protein n=1 Tax=Halteria grandinella TaxID=5974 RepID=A0A8J8P5C2_HALGN|nr:hypothetical protein FGO68_gene3996 [Halteria grandinella]